MPRKSYSPSEGGNINATYADSNPNLNDPVGTMPSESTLLAGPQTYFADERVRIPETSHVNLFHVVLLCLIRNFAGWFQL